ncbi:MAG: sigma-70 family RNA polymerase sigma factor [Patescibacteria group bacterium]
MEYAQSRAFEEDSDNDFDVVDAPENNVIAFEEAKALHDSRKKAGATVVKIVEDRPVEQLKDVSLTADPINDYFKRLGMPPRLTQQQEVELAKSIEVGVFAQERLDNESYQSDEEKADLEYLVRVGQRDKEFFIHSNLRLAISNAKQFTGRGVPFLDLIQEANEGLVRAVEMFDHKKGFKFSTYATWLIRKPLLLASADLGREIRVPAKVQAKLTSIAIARINLTNLLGQEPTLDEIADEVDIPVNKLKEMIETDRITYPASLNQVINDEENIELGDRVVDRSAPIFTDEVHYNIQQDERRDFIEELMEGLSLREVQVLRLRFGIDNNGIELAYSEVAKRIGISEGLASAVVLKALRKLKEKAVDENLVARNKELTRD